MDRRGVIKGGLAAAGVLSMPAYLRAQSNRKLSFLTWNIADQEVFFKELFADFIAENPGVEIEWLDKKGPDLPAFYQTQLVAGTAPDVVDLQGMIWVEWAANGALLDLAPYLEAEPEVKALYNQDYLSGFDYQGGTYLLPFYIAKTLLFWNKTMFQEAGLAGPPTSFDELMDYSRAMASGEKTGYLTLNFDWLYWPIMEMNGIRLLEDDLRTPAFNTPEAAAVLERLAAETDSGGINKISWTGRWVEPNGAFAAGNVGMLQAHANAYFFVKGQGPWINADTLGATMNPGNWATPTNHAFAVSKTAKDPDLAWAFVKHLSGNKWASAFALSRITLTGNVAADNAVLEKVKVEEPLAYDVLQTQLAHTDKMCGNWPLPNDAQVKDAFWAELQNALLGRKDAKTALADAEKAVERVMRRS